ncbi:MAG: YbhB/YbcL family Raf kinase inhibitor-like protein [Acidobacteria bacterium]|nr:YbhB/YbcL family Raf kinase inhibitor-like protein [Acidobacteriota bacterium]
MSLTLTSPAFAHEDEIPKLYTCDSRNISPPLAWSGLPKGTASLALVVDDPDAPDPAAPKTRWVHWVLYNLPPSVQALPQALTSRELPSGAAEGLNDWNRRGYGGPCPPIGRHRYVLRLFALDTVLPDLKSPTRDKLLKAIDGHVLEEAELIGTYERAGRSPY